MYETDLIDFQWQVIQEIESDTCRRKISAASDYQCVALPDQERLPVAALAARISTLPAGLLLFPPLASRWAPDPAQTSPGAPPTPAGRYLAPSHPECCHPRC
jgi:hypothetical protein